jgi:hypothetical protein
MDPAMTKGYKQLVGWLAIVAYILVLYYIGHINFHTKRADLALLVMALMSFLTVFAILKTCGSEDPDPKDK